jgi:DNA-binding HxlR family transcriptional regulator
MCRIARVAAGSISLAGSFAGCLLRSASACASSCLQAVIFCWARGISSSFLVLAAMAGSASSFASATSALASAVLAFVSAFSGGEGRVGFQLGVHYFIGVIVGERVEAVVDHVVFEHVLLGPPAAQPAGQLGRARVEPPADRLGDHLAVLEQGQLPDGLAVVVHGDLLVGPGDLALAAAAQGDGLHDGQQRGGREGGAPPGQPVIPGRVYRGEGAGERRPAVEHDQRPAGRAGLVARWEGVGERRERGRQGGAQRGGLAGGERDRPSGQVADIGVVVALGGLAAARVAAERDRLVAGVLSDVVIGQVPTGTERPGDLIEAINAQATDGRRIGWKVLNDTLRRLERSGYVTRQEMQRVPRETRYWLRPPGHRLLAALRLLDTWYDDQEPGDDSPGASSGGQAAGNCNDSSGAARTPRSPAA